ncbi:hypothetical protein [uncultured Sphingomonas sp.]|uniref:hypothetical protein n=1 Tax=uncultured Sphingomonas sp. TaxID=158754 RepID=UPI0025FE0D00|nr:hypothetical protein [uncultured Sphingomonas sp.]
MILAALLLAQAAAPACPTTPAALPAQLAGWRTSGDDLASGKAVTLDTWDPRTVRMLDVPLPQRPGRAANRAFRIKTSGTYGIALDQKGWIDLYRLRETTPIASTAHGHGPACSGIRKIVRFALTPGEYQVVVGGLDSPRAKLLLVSDAK